MTRSSLGHQALIAGIAAALYFTSLGATRLWDDDEAFFAAAAAEMHRHDDWIVPTFNEELFAHKPPFMYWVMRCGFAAFGVNELGARIGSAVFALLTSILVYHLGRILFSPRVGLWGGVCFSTCLMWSVVARAATADCYLTFFTTASLLVYVRDVFGSKRLLSSQRKDNSDAPRITTVLVRWLPQRTSVYLAIYSLMALAVLVKGPIGVLLPGATIGLFVLLQMPWKSDAGHGRMRRIFSRLKPFLGRPLAATFWHMRPFTAIGVVLVIAGPWFALVGWKTNGAFLQEFFGVHNFGRFLQPMENHRGPIFYYLPVLLVGMFPWSIFTLPTISNAARRSRQGEENSQFQFLVCWSAVMVGFFSIASTKLPNYVIPAYPAIAMLVAAWMNAWMTHRETTWRRWPAIAFTSLVVVGVLMIAGLWTLGQGGSAGRPLAERIGMNAALAPDLARLAWIGIIPLIGGGIAWWAFRRGSRMLSMNAVAVVAVMLTGGLLIFGAQVVNRHQTSAAIADAIHRRDDQRPVIGAYRHGPPSLVFYAGQHVERLRDASAASQFLNGAGARYLVTTDAGIRQMTGSNSPPTTLVDERPLFPKPGILKVLAPAGQGMLTAADPAAVR